MSNFRIGEIAIGQNIIGYPEYNGMECEIIRGLCSRRIHNGLTGEDMGVRDVYRVKWADGERSSQEPHQLRKKHEPGNWDDLKDEYGKIIWIPMITAGKG